jgi:hypothetical protein
MLKLAIFGMYRLEIYWGKCCILFFAGGSLGVELGFL